MHAFTFLAALNPFMDKAAEILCAFYVWNVVKHLMAPFMRTITV